MAGRIHVVASFCGNLNTQSRVWLLIDGDNFPLHICVPVLLRRDQLDVASIKYLNFITLNHKTISTYLINSPEGSTVASLVRTISCPGLNAPLPKLKLSVKETWAIILSVMDTSAPCFYLWSRNCKYLQLLSFMAV